MAQLWQVRCTFAVTWELHGDRAVPPPSPPPVRCEAYSTSGFWVRLGSYAASCEGCLYTYTRTVGTQTSTGRATTRTWQESVERSITDGIEVSATLGLDFLGAEGCLVAVRNWLSIENLHQLHRVSTRYDSIAKLSTVNPGSSLADVLRMALAVPIQRGRHLWRRNHQDEPLCSDCRRS